MRSQVISERRPERQAALLDRLQRADEDLGRPGDDRGRRIRVAEKHARLALPERPRGCRRGSGPADREGRAARTPRRSRVSALGREDVGAGGDQRDAPVAEADQVVDRLTHAGGVVGHD